MKKLEIEVNFTNLKYLWSMFCGHENQLEEHYYVDEDNQKMYRKLTSIYTDEQIDLKEITDTQAIIWIYEIHLKGSVVLTDNEAGYLELRVEQDLDDMPEEVGLDVDMLTKLKSKLTNIKN